MSGSYLRCLHTGAHHGMAGAVAAGCSSNTANGDSMAVIILQRLALNAWEETQVLLQRVLNKLRWETVPPKC